MDPGRCSVPRGIGYGAGTDFDRAQGPDRAPVLRGCQKTAVAPRAPWSGRSCGPARRLGPWSSPRWPACAGWGRRSRWVPGRCPKAALSSRTSTWPSCPGRRPGARRGGRPRCRPHASARVAPGRTGRAGSRTASVQVRPDPEAVGPGPRPHRRVLHQLLGAGRGLRRRQGEAAQGRHRRQARVADGRARHHRAAGRQRAVEPVAGDGEAGGRPAVSVRRGLRRPGAVP